MTNRKNIWFSPKILLNMVAIAFFMFGCVLLHAVYNDTSLGTTMSFFTIQVQKIVIFDSAILCVSLAFFIEFYLTFRPIHIFNEEKVRE